METQYVTLVLVLILLLLCGFSVTQVTYKDGCQGTAGIPGLPGRDGRDGRDGQAITGAIGPKGDPGQQGANGPQGNCICPERNIKQCAWRDIDDRKDTGQIQSCNFTKNLAHTALRVVWNGDLRVYNNDEDASCSRWYITFNGGECDAPHPIDIIIVSTQENRNQHRPAHIEGICAVNNTGRVRVGLDIGGCGMGALGNAHTGWLTTSRIIIEEIYIEL